MPERNKNNLKQMRGGYFKGLELLTAQRTVLLPGRYPLLAGSESKRKIVAPRLGPEKS
jgi:hypothetical protein